MKLYHFAIAFTLITITLFIMADVKTKDYVAVAKEKDDINQSFYQAVNDAAKNLVVADGIDRLTINKKRAVNNFFLSLFANLDITDNPDKQDFIRNYIPVIAVTYDDGYYIYYSDEYKKSDHNTYINKRWSEKIPYYYEDNDFIYSFTLSDILTIYDKNNLLDTTGEQKLFTLDYHELSIEEDYSYFRSQRPDSFLLKDESYYLIKKESIIQRIENSMSYFCNKHNKIAQQFGITYNFAMPVIDNSEWTRAIDNPGIIILFQGYPYGGGVGEQYNQFAIAGAQINKNKVYYIEQKDWYFIYHSAGCPELKKDGILFLDEPFYTIEEVVKKGAYACVICQPSGVHAPEYTP